MTPADIAKLCQNCIKTTPTIVLGSGASVPHGIMGMGELAKWLLENVSPKTKLEADAWSDVGVSLSEGQNLEVALETKNLSGDLIDQIVRNTWKFIAESDNILLLNAIIGYEDFPITRLFSGLFKSTEKILML